METDSELQKMRSREAELRVAVRGGNDDAAAELLALVLERDNCSKGLNRILEDVFDGNEKLAFQWAHKNSRGKYAAEGCFWLAVCFWEFYEGTSEIVADGEEDKVAMRYLLKSFRLGNKWSASLLANQYLKYNRCKSDKNKIKKALYWAKIAIAKNDPDGFRALGEVYEAKEKDGGQIRSLTYNVKKAIACYEKALAAGCIFALENLYELYLELANNVQRGHPVRRKKYLEVFKKWCEAAIDCGNASACKTLASVYYGCYEPSFYLGESMSFEETQKIPKAHLLKAAELWQKAFELMPEGTWFRCQNCCRAAGAFYEIGDPRAFELAKIAATQDDDGDAYYFWGLCYKEGIGVEKNLEKAIECFKASGKHSCNSEEAIEYIALTYYEAKDPRAFKTLRSIKYPDVLAKYLLGRCYYEGFGTKKNFKKR